MENYSKEQLQAAYALNLCTVSVSQIVAYDDINILEQEYEAILNNLNLELIPKDEALLDILKRLLDTITFFRIQERDKAMIDREYQQKMKNAIWASVPNFGMLIAGGNLLTTSISLASQIGIGYMNYRKNKSEYQMELEKQEWQLQRTAMEQFEALQQQLFVTAWRLADKYQFTDNLRLTEKQVKRYNAILMDEDEIRKYERLCSIQDQFAAYPPFWYYLGNTANSIARNNQYGLSDEDKQQLFKKAKAHFEKYEAVNSMPLLREDMIASACKLEYADLLDVKTDRDKIETLMDSTVKNAGTSWDILQMCAMTYLKIQNYEKAEKMLRILVNEDYNAITNAQILSSIYVNRYIGLKDVHAKRSYAMLTRCVSEDYLLPMPQDYATSEIALRDFINNQKAILKEKYSLVLKMIVEKYQKKVNLIIPLPAITNKPLMSINYASDKPEAKRQRLNIIREACKYKNKYQDYFNEVQDIIYTDELCNILNQMFASICLFEGSNDENTQEELEESISKALRSQKTLINEIERNWENFNEDLYQKVQQIDLRSLTKPSFEIIAKHLKASIESKKTMDDFSISDVYLQEICNREGFPNPEILYAQRNDNKEVNLEVMRFTEDLFDEETQHRKALKSNGKKMLEIIKGHTHLINSQQVELYTNDECRVDKYFASNVLRKSGKRRNTLAVLEDYSKQRCDLLFTSEGVIPIVRGKMKEAVQYSNVKKTDDGSALKFDTIRFKGEYAQIKNIFLLIQELSRYASTPS